MNTAVLIAREIEDLGVTWYEEPVLPDNIDALAAVRRRVRVPVAAGERFYDEGRVAEAIARDAVDVLQPDICHVGGLSGMMKIAALASASMIPVAPHNVNGPVGNAMTLHAVAAMPGASILETYFADAPWRSDVFSESARIIDGEMLIPDGPGPGIDFNAEAAANHPYAPHPMRHYSDVRLRGCSDDAVPWYTIDA